MREYPSAKVDEAYEKTATASGNAVAYVRRAMEEVSTFKLGRFRHLASVAFGNAWNGPSLRVEQSDDHRAKESRTKSAQKGPVDVNLETKPEFRGAPS